MKEAPSGDVHLSRSESASLTCMLAATERYEIMSMSTAELKTFLAQTEQCLKPVDLPGRARAKEGVPSR
jgi:hypothetical protein